MVYYTVIPPTGIELPLDYSFYAGPTDSMQTRLWEAPFGNPISVADTKKMVSLMSARPLPLTLGIWKENVFASRAFTPKLNCWQTSGHNAVPARRSGTALDHQTSSPLQRRIVCRGCARTISLLLSHEISLVKHYHLQINLSTVGQT